MMKQKYQFEAGEEAKLLSFLNGLIKEKKYVFRGYGKQEQLMPSIIRESEKYKANEKDLLYQLERYGSKFFVANSPIEFMSHGQHFGLPTRLLDFTYNPFVALFFSLSDNKGSSGQDKDYYYLLFADIKENILVDALPPIQTCESISFCDNAFAMQAYETIEHVEKIWKEKNADLDSYLNRLHKHLMDSSLTLDGLKEKVENYKILFVTPNFSNERIMVQQGLFMFPWTLNKGLHHRILAENTSCIKINKKMRNSLLEYLGAIGLDAFHLMPDLSSICESIKKSYIKPRENEYEAKYGQLSERLEMYKLLASNVKLLTPQVLNEMDSLYDEFEKLGKTIEDKRITMNKATIRQIESGILESLKYISEISKKK